MVKGKIDTLAYSSTRDYRNAGFTFLGGESIYRPGFERIAWVIGHKEVEEAKQRVSIDSKGKYKYIPSDDYIQAISRLRLNKLNIKTHEKSQNECIARKG